MPVRILSRRQVAALAAASFLCSHPSLPAATFFWKTSAATSSWNSGNNWSATSPSGVDNTGVPNNASTVNITLADGISRTIAYDYTGPAITVNLLQINLTGNPANVTSLNMTANTLTVAIAYIGNSGAGTNGRGAISQTGGTFNVTPTGTGFFLGLNPTDTGFYNLGGTGALAANNVQIIGHAGTGIFTQTGGTNTALPGFNSIYIGSLAGSHGTYNLSGGSLISNCPVYVGSNGTGTFNHTGGSSSLGLGAPLYIGTGASASGSYFLSAGILTSSTHEYLGHSGAGTFTQSGGIHTLNPGASLNLGTNAGSNGLYHLAGGSLTASAPVYVGNLGNGTVNHSAGAHTITTGNTLYLGYGTGSRGNYTLSGGTLSANTISLATGANSISTFSQAGGTLIATNIQVSIANLNGASASYIQTGGITVLSGPLQLGSSGASFHMNGGTLTTSAFMNSNPFNTFNWTGGTINVTASAFSTPQFTSVSITNPFGGAFTGANPGNDGWIIDSMFTIAAPGSITVGTPAAPRNLAIASSSLNGTLTLSHPGASLFVSGNASVTAPSSGSNSGALVISAGAMTVMGPLIAYSNGRITLAGGTLTASAIGTYPFRAMGWFGGALNVTVTTVDTARFSPYDANFNLPLLGNQSGHFTGADASNSAFTLTGRATNDIVTQGGTSTMTIGTPQAPRHLSIGIGTDPTLIATYNLNSPSASLLVNGNVYVGGTTLGRGAVSTFNLNSGIASLFGTLKLWNTGTLNFTGGSLALTHLDASSNPAGINWTSGHLRLRGGTILGPAILRIPGTGVLSGTGSLVGNVTLTGAINLNAPYDNLAIHGTIAGTGNVAVSPTATLLTQALRITSLTLGGTARLLPAGAGASKLDALVIAGSTNNWTGQLDLTDNALVIQSTGPGEKAGQIPAIQNQILSGKNSGLWNGPGITSSSIPTIPDTSLALADNATLGYTSFRSLTVDANSLLLAIALLGDATLDNNVDAFDLNRLASNWQSATNVLWSDGDFNQDVKVDAFDLNLLAAQWQFGTTVSSPSLTQALTPSLIPEPASLALLTLASPLLLRRRLRT
jgi:hypothetical protein